ncbi:MAG: hypothetical protein QOE61_5029 [Micromonosporaceae bacterium]|nr:hypothetical protein [Micromonosporaceae bacterium]
MSTVVDEGQQRKVVQPVADLGTANAASSRRSGRLRRTRVSMVPGVFLDASIHLSVSVRHCHANRATHPTCRSQLPQISLTMA